jgi:hypothetical protein
VQARRNEQLARKNPDRIQKQIDGLKEITKGGGKLSKHEEQVLEGLEKELRSVNKAREALGDKAPTFRREWGDRDSRPGGVLGKRRRSGDDASSSDEDVPDDVKRIPMPRDTPPPIPKEVLDEWYAKRRAQREAENAARRREAGDNDEGDKKQATPAVVESKTVYSAAPVTRNLRQEAVAAFVPTAVKMKLDKGKGQGGLIEPEEADRLEQEGYLKTRDEGPRTSQDSGTDGDELQPQLRTVTIEDAEDEEG